MIGLFLRSRRAQDGRRGGRLGASLTAADAPRRAASPVADGEV